MSTSVALPRVVHREVHADEALCVCLASTSDLALVGLGGEVVALDREGSVPAAWALRGGARFLEWSDALVLVGP